MAFATGRLLRRNSRNRYDLAPVASPSSASLDSVRAAIKGVAVDYDLVTPKGVVVDCD